MVAVNVLESSKSTKPSKPVFDPNPNILNFGSDFYRVSRIHENLGKFPTISCKFLPQSEHLTLEADEPEVLHTDIALTAGLCAV